jgi:hypothetical protein
VSFSEGDMMHICIDTNACLLLFCLLMQPLQASADTALSRPIIDFFSLVASTLYSRGRTSITLDAYSQPEIGGQGRMSKCGALLLTRIAHALKLGRGTRDTRPSSRFSVTHQPPQDCRVVLNIPGCTSPGAWAERQQYITSGCGGKD